MKPLTEDQIRVFRIDDNHVAVSAYEHLGYRHWVKVKVESKQSHLTVEQVLEEAGLKWWVDASRAYADVQRDDRMLRILAAVITANTSGDGEFQQRADAWHDALKKYLTP